MNSIDPVIVMLLFLAVILLTLILFCAFVAFKMLMKVLEEDNAIKEDKAELSIAEERNL